MQRLDERKEKILYSIVRDYLETAEPVGSRTIWRNHIHGLSPATIRNEMSDLEELGLIRQPHTSAGRIPTDLGYRYYVDYLMRNKPLTAKEQAFMKHEYRRIHNEVDELLHKSLKVISSLCDYTAVVYLPSLYQRMIKIVQMVLLNLHQVMVVLLTDTGTNNIILEFPNLKDKGFGQDDLNKISSLLTQQLSGTPVKQIDDKLVKKIINEMPAYRDILEKALAHINESLSAQNEDKVLSAGLSKMLKQPEYIDVEQMRNILELVEHEKVLAKVLKDCSQHKGLTVKIGRENIIKDMEDVSLVFSSIQHEGVTKAGIGLFGPTRMSYNKSISLIDSISNEIDRFFNEEELLND